METILAKIIADKRDWIAARKITQPLKSFIQEIIPSDRDFYAALSSKPAKFILECKKASPSKGLIREDFDLNVIAQIYAKHAAVISVLTDEKYFQGQLDFIALVRKQVQCPVLCKDFILDPYQVYLARYYQADAILLMLSALNDEQYIALSTLAQTLNLGVLTEISNEEERTRAVLLNAKVVGINNRDLRDLSIDLNRTKNLAPLLPKTCCVISESGIHTHQQVRALAPYVNGFLIGSALMQRPDLEHAVRQIIFGDNKICGLTREEDAKAAFDAGANYGGLIFVKASPRCIDLETAQNIMSAAPLSYVGVFQNHPIEHVINITQALNLFAVQLHGDENDEYVSNLRSALSANKNVKTQIWKAHSVGETTPQLTAYADKHLLDTRVGAQCGGTGQAFNWSLIPKEQKESLILAGGLSSENAKEAAALGCAGLDFNSGVESRAGIKDKLKINAVFCALRDY